MNLRKILTTIVLITSLNVAAEKPPHDDYKHEVEAKNHLEKHNFDNDKKRNKDIEKEEHADGNGSHHEDEAKDFAISIEAAKHFALQFLKVESGSKMNLPRAAVVSIKNEQFLYRSRNGKFTRVHFIAISENQNSLIASSEEVKTGDQIVVAGVNYLRLAELALTSDEPEGHSH